jgi:hypothetical protein
MDWNLVILIWFMAGSTVLFIVYENKYVTSIVERKYLSYFVGQKSS